MSHPPGLGSIPRVWTSPIWRWLVRRVDSTLHGTGLGAVLLGLVLLNSTPRPKVDLDGPSTGHFTLGSAFIEKKQPRKAIPHFEKSARLGDPHRSGSYLRLGELDFELGEEDRALGNFSRSIDFETRRWEEVADFLLAPGEVAARGALLQSETGS